MNGDQTDHQSAPSASSRSASQVVPSDEKPGADVAPQLPPTPDMVAQDEPGKVAPAAVPLPQPLWMQFYSSLAFAFSALLSPYLVIPVGTVVIVASRSVGTRQFLLWTGLSVLFSTVIPALYVVIQILRGKITDVHVMEREQRGGPFFVAVASSATGALILRYLGAPAEVWGIGLVLMLNGIILSWITTFWKISMHVAVLSASVLSVLVMVKGVNVWSLVWMIPALMWARATRGRHSIWQGLAGCAVACGITGGALASINLWPRVLDAAHRALGSASTLFP
jgi:hypothetical protein